MQNSGRSLQVWWRGKQWRSGHFRLLLTPRPIALSAVSKLEVTPLELLFDVVFAFAVSQLPYPLLGHDVVSHLSVQGTLEALTLLLVVYPHLVNCQLERGDVGGERPLGALTPLRREYFERMVIWLLAWRLWSAQQPPETRLWVWAMTMLVDFAGGCHP